MKILELELASIEVGTDRARELDKQVAEGLAGSIREQGLMQPIVVRPKGEGWCLVAGRHRLEAHRILGRDSIQAVVTEADSDDAAKLAEVMENLARYELIALDRCRHLYDLKQVWERLYPHTKNGGDPATKAAAARRQSLPSGEDAPEIFGFSEANAERIGLSARAIRLAVKIWTGLYPAVRARLRGSDLATKQTELKALSELPINKQIKVLDAIENENLPDVGNVSQALAYLAGGVAEASTEKQFQSVRTAFSKLPDAAFDMVVSAEADRVIAALKRLGRI